MNALADFMSADHARLDALLDRIVRDDGSIDEDAYAPFRRGLLTHIGAIACARIPKLPVAPHSDTPHLRYSIELLLKRAGR